MLLLPPSIVGPIEATTILRQGAYDPVSNQVLTITDAAGHTTTHTYDSAGNLIQRQQVVAGQPLTETFTYDSVGQLIEQRDANDNPTTYTWDSIKGSIESITDALNQTTQIATDPLGRVTAITDHAGNTFNTTWDERDRLVSLTDPFGNTATLTYDKVGRQTGFTTPRGTVGIDYDAASRVTMATDPQGNTQRLEYDATGDVTTSIDSLGNQTLLLYDALGRRIAQIDPLGYVWSFGYCAEIGGGCSAGDCGGSSDPVAADSYCELTDPLGNTTLREQDALGRVVRITDPVGNETEIAYDKLGRTTAVTDPMGHIVHREYDSGGRLVAVVESDGSRTEYRYDGNGNLINIRDAEDNDWPRSYDALNRLVSESDPLGNTTSYTYDALGNLKTKRTPNGDLISYDYEVRRLNAVSLPGGAVETYGYDTLGRRSSMENGEVSLGYVYDELNRLSQVINHTLSQTIAYEYDSAGRQIQAVLPQGVVEYDYDANGRLVEQSDPVTGVYRYGYDALGRRTTLEYPNGVATTYEYDTSGRILSLITRDPQDQIVDGYSYTYDQVGNRTSMRTLHDGVIHTYQYDPLRRLTRWERGAERFESYSYDRLGNRLELVDQLGKTTYSYDLANRLLTEVREPNDGGTATTTYSWDTNGNLLEKVKGGVTNTYEWDALNRLIGRSDGSGIHAYGYDPDGIRVRETDGSETRRFLHSQEDIIAVYDDSLNLTTYYTHGPGIDESLAQATLSEETSYLHHDGLGSVTALSSQSGQISGTVSYAAFGSIESISGLSSRYAFTGREGGTTDLLYYRARYYQPNVGRFISGDPFEGTRGVPASLHRYVYGHNNPVNLTDPSGLAVDDGPRDAFGHGDSLFLCFIFFVLPYIAILILLARLTWIRGGAPQWMYAFYRWVANALIWVRVWLWAFPLVPLLRIVGWGSRLWQSGRSVVLTNWMYLQDKYPVLAMLVSVVWECIAGIKRSRPEGQPIAGDWYLLLGNITVLVICTVVLLVRRVILGNKS